MIYERPGKRRMRWVVEYYDDTRKRRYKTCYSREDAERFQAERVLEPGGNPLVTVEDIATRWLEISRVRVRPQTLDHYERVTRVHVLPELGARRASTVRPSDVELLLARKLESGLKPKSVALIQSTIHGIFKRALRDGVVRYNPAAGLTGELRLTRRSKAPERIKAMTPEELDAFLVSAKARYPNLYPLFYTMASTGLRIGEALGLRWSDVDFEGVVDGGERVYGIHVERTMLRGGRVDQTKTGKSRRVDLAPAVRDVLYECHREHQRRHLEAGRTLSDWVFQRATGKPLDAGDVRERFKTILAGAGLPLTFTPHALRHTFASIHIKAGTDMAYVKEQLGHWSIKMTYDTYGHWLIKSSGEAASRFQELIGSKK